MSAQYLPCSRCGAATEYATLSMLGARCQPCYDAYRAERPDTTTRTPQGRLPGFRPKPRLASSDLPIEATTTMPALPQPHRVPTVDDDLSERAFSTEGLDA